MKWLNRGVFFDPTTFDSSGRFIEFAQSPQCIVFNDFVRIYFSTRSRDNKGEYLSHIAYVDTDLNFSTILKYSKHEILPLGALGAFDEHGIFPISPFRDGNDLYAFTSGWNRRVSVPVDTGIGLCKSLDNGDTFTRLGNGPVLGPTINEPFLVGDGFVLKHNDVYFMWYIFGTKWLPASDIEPVGRVYKIGYATSNDLINWKKNEGIQIISDVLNENECQALPTVIKIDEIYHMYFCFREATDFRKNPNRGYQLGYAFSNDLINWTRDDPKSGIFMSNNPNDWDGVMQCYPHLTRVNNKVFLLYNGNEFGKYGFGIAELID